MFKLKADLNHSEQWKGFYVQRPQGEEQKRRDEAVSREGPWGRPSRRGAVLQKPSCVASKAAPPPSPSPHGAPRHTGATPSVSGVKIQY